MDGLFSKDFEKRFVFQLFEKIPPPPAAAAPGGGGIFSNNWKTNLFSKSLEKRPIHIFLNDTFHFFQITIIYKGTQVTRFDIDVIEGFVILQALCN